MGAGGLAITIAAVAALQSGQTVCPSGVSVIQTPHAPVRCAAASPKIGQTFSGPVLQVIDGRTLCLAQGPTPADWVQVRLEGAAQAADRAALMRATFAKRLNCVAVGPSPDGVIARCALAGAPPPATPAT